MGALLPGRSVHGGGGGDSKLTDLHLYETATGRRLWEEVEAWPPFSSDGRLLAAAFHDGILVRETATGKEVARFPPPPAGENFDLAFTPDGRDLVVHQGQPGGNPALHFWEVATRRERRMLGLPPSDVGVLLFSPDGRTAVVGRHRDRAPYALVLVETASGRERGEVRFPDVMPGMSWPPKACFAPDGRSLLIADGEGSVVVVDPLTGRRLYRRGEHRGRVNGIVFSPSGRLLATTGDDDTALVWKADDFLRPARLPRVPISADDELSALWSDLAADDAVKAAHAIRKLSQDPDRALSALRQHLHPVREVSPEDQRRLSRLLADLDADEFAVRKEAQERIEQFEEAARTALEKVLAGWPSAEVRSTVEGLLSRLGPDHPPDGLRTLRALEALEQMNTPEARDLLRRLAGGAPGARLTREAKEILGRLTRRGAVP
jgi:hypothetical protein